MHLLFLPANPCLLGELQWHLKLGSTEKFSTHQLWASVWGWAWADAKATGKAHRKCQQVLLSNRLRQLKKLPALCWCNLLLPNCWSRPGTLCKLPFGIAGGYATVESSPPRCHGCPWIGWGCWTWKITSAMLSPDSPCLMSPSRTVATRGIQAVASPCCDHK